MDLLNKLPTDIIYLILQYAGEIRILKRKMTKENVFRIINDDVRYYDSIVDFIFSIVDRPFYTGPTIGYIYYWDLLKEIRDNKVCSVKYNISKNLLDKLINVFINDYNYYYLDDNYYIHSFWMDAICYTDYASNIKKETKNEVECYRHHVFGEIEKYF